MALQQTYLKIINLNILANVMNMSEGMQLQNKYLNINKLNIYNYFLN